MLLPPAAAPDAVPVLSAGRHRSPRRGACFMEMASYLAGERWSDHPACTHPLLATAARFVNDLTSDDARSGLALLVPSVVGLTSDDPHLPARLVRAAAGHALPVASEPRQRVLAVGVLTCDRALAVLDGRDPAQLEPATREVLSAAPLARAWAERFAAEAGVEPPPVRGARAGAARARRDRAFLRHTAPHLVGLAVRSVAEAVAPDADARLHALLDDLVAVTAAHASAAPGVEPHVVAQRWPQVGPQVGPKRSTLRAPAGTPSS